MTERRDSRAPVLGLVGGIGSGKSTVAELLARKGARVIDADRLGHEALRDDAVKGRLRAAFGDCVFGPAGDVSHGALAAQAFGRASEVKKLNDIVHPPILMRIREEARRLAHEADVPLVVLDAALLLETGLHDEVCDAVLFVDTPREVRRKRAAEQRGLSPEQFDKREEAQILADEKQRHADYTVTNTGTKDQLKEQLDGLWPELCRHDRRRAGSRPAIEHHLNP